MINCNEMDWQILKNADEQSDEYRRCAFHLDLCHSCRSHWMQLTHATVAWWGEARSVWLAEELPMPSELIETHSVLMGLVDTHDNLDEDEASRLLAELFEAPSHPELLGRIGRYDVERVIGKGGMGIVLKGYDSELHRAVAIKVLAPHLAHSVAARKRFAREARAAAAVVHSHVVPIYDVESEGKLPYIVMKYVSGQSLQARIEGTGPESVSNTLRIAQQVASGLAAAHIQGLVHRDVKPGNVLLEESVERVLLSDFGLARTADDASLTRTGVLAGTPHYMSPEQARGENIDARSDLFCLGSIMYFMLSGHPPFRAEGAMAILHRICNEAHRPIDQVNTDVPYEVARLIDRLLTKTAGDRIGAADIVEKECCELLALLQSGGLSLRPSISRRRTEPSWVPIPRWVWGTVLMVACVAMGLSIASITNRPTPPINDRQVSIASEKELSVRELREIQQEFTAMEKQASEWETSLGNVSEKLAAMDRELRSPQPTQTHDPFWIQSTELILRLRASND